VSRELIDVPPGPFVHRWTVRLQDVDAAGVVFFPRILELFNDTLFAYADAAGCSLVTLMLEDRVVLPVRRAEAEYLKPLRFGEIVEVAPVRCRMDGPDVALGFRLARGCRAGEPGEVAAVGITEHVCVDAEQFCRTEVPGRLLAALRPIPAFA